jgi:hypothetical protein
MKSVFFLLLIIAAHAPIIVFAQGKYAPLVTIPGVTDKDGANFSEYINFLYGAAIAIAALLAVVKLIIAGVKYMLTDIVPNKSQAIGDIRNALFGLLLIIGSVIILNTINPELSQNKIVFQEIPKKPDIFDRPSVTVSGKTADQLAASLVPPGSCVTSTKVEDRSRKGSFFTLVDSGACKASDNPGEITAQAQINCLKESGVWQKISDTQFRCTVPQATYEIKGSELSSYTGINQSFLTKKDTLVSYDVNGACDAKVATSQNKQYDFNACMGTAAGPFKDYCDSNYGQWAGTTAVRTCNLPADRKDSIFFKDAYATYQQTHPDAKYTSFENMSVNVYEELCSAWGGTPLDKNGIGTGHESYTCVKYNKI